MRVETRFSRDDHRVLGEVIDIRRSHRWPLRQVDLYRVGLNPSHQSRPILKTIMISKPRKWFGQRSTYKPLQNQPRIVQRPVTNLRFLKKAPYKVTYGEFSYAVQAVVLEEEKVSYIAARMVTANGRLHQPLHEYELSRRFPTLTGADEAWSGGFEAKEDEFLCRSLIHRLLEEQAAELISIPDLSIPLVGSA